MTVSTTTSRADYTGNSVTVAFSVPFYFLDNTHVRVIRTQISTGVETILTLTTDYSLTGATVPAGGTATMVTAPTTDQKISVLRNVPLTQLAHYVPNDPFPAATHEQALDQLTMVTQQLNEAIGRALILSAATSGVSATLPAPAANAFIGWDANGTAIINYAGISNVTISSAMQPVVQANSTLTALGLIGGAASGNNSDITRLNNLTAIGGNVTVPTQAPGDSSGLIASTAFVANASPAALFTINANATAAGNLTINTSGPVRVDFRNTNTTTGTPLTAITSSNLSITVPLGATLGTVLNNVSSLVPLFLYNNGTPTLGLVNPIGFNFDESRLLNTTVLNATSNTSGVVYSATALTSTPFKAASLIEVNQTAAGNWSGTIKRVTPVGGSVQPGRMMYVQFPTVATTSGTAIDFTGIPAGAKRITVMLNGVSTAGTSFYLLRLGDGAIVATGYTCSCMYGTTGTTDTVGFVVANGVAASEVFSGILVLTYMGTNLWALSGAIGAGTTVRTATGSKTLVGTLDRIRLTTVNGTDTFDNGSVNVMVEW